MTPGEIEIFADSFDRCMADERFFDIFYDRFVASSPAVADRFAHTDDRRQKRAVRASLYLIMSCTVRSEADYSPLEPLAERHSRQQLDIGPELYRLWLDSLIESVQTCDPRFDLTIERVWRHAMRQAIDFLVSRY
jgi:hemoglobin-like flavoprotein